jgi:hypothetical protein
MPRFHKTKKMTGHGLDASHIHRRAGRIDSAFHTVCCGAKIF